MAQILEFLFRWGVWREWSGQRAQKQRGEEDAFELRKLIRGVRHGSLTHADLENHC